MDLSARSFFGQHALATCSFLWFAGLSFPFGVEPPTRRPGTFLEVADPLLPLKSITFFRQCCVFRDCESRLVSRQFRSRFFFPRWSRIVFLSRSLRWFFFQALSRFSCLRFFCEWSVLGKVHASDYRSFVRSCEEESPFSRPDSVPSTRIFLSPGGESWQPRVSLRLAFSVGSRGSLSSDGLGEAPVRLVNAETLPLPRIRPLSCSKIAIEGRVPPLCRLRPSQCIRP